MLTITVTYRWLLGLHLFIQCSARSRESFADLMLSIDNHIPAVSSYLESGSSLGAKSVHTSPNHRRRIEPDVDCDQAYGEVDCLESMCDKVRYDVLVSLVPNMTEIRTINNSITAVLNGLFREFFIANGTDQNPANLMKQIYQLKTMTYGGLDPSTNKSDQGLIVRAYENTQALKRLQRLAEASLDTVWANIDVTQRAVYERVYNQVLAVAAATERFLQNLQNKSEHLMSAYRSNLKADIASVNDQLINITETICEKQDQINRGGKDLIKAVDELPSISDRVDDLVNRYETVLEKFDDASSENDNIMFDMATKSESIASFGLDSVETYIQNFADSFSDSLEKFLSTFFDNQRLQTDLGVKQMSDIALNRTNQILDAIEARKEKSRKNRMDLDDNLNKVKSIVNLQIAKVASAKAGHIDEASSSVSNLLASATRASNGFTSSQREIDGELQSSETSINSTLSNAAGDLSDLIQSGSQNAKSLFNSGLGSLQSLQGKFQGKLGEQLLTSQTAVAGTDDSAARSFFDSASTMNDQVKLIDSNHLLSESKMDVLNDQTSGMMESSMTPLLSTVTLLGTNLLDLSSSISDRKNSAQSDIDRASSALESADADAILEANANIDSSLSWSRSQLANQMRTSSDSASLAIYNLTSSLAKFSEAQKNADFMDSQLDAYATTKFSLGQVASDLSAIDSGTAQQFEKKLDQAEKSTNDGMIDVSQQVLNDLKKREGPVTSELAAIMSSLSDNIKKGGGDFAGKNIQKSILQVMARVQSGMSNLTKSEDLIANKFKRSILEFARIVENKLPFVFETNRRKLKSNLKKIRQDSTRNMKLMNGLFESKVRSLLSKWDIDETSKKLNEDLVQLKDDIVPIEAVLNSTIGGFVSAIPKVYGPFAQETSDIVTEEGRKLNEQIHENEEDLNERISNMTSDVRSKIGVIRSSVDDAMSSATDSWKNATDALTSLESRDANGTSTLYKISERSSNATSDLLTKLDTIVENALNNRKGVSGSSFDPESISVNNLTDQMTGIMTSSDNTKSVAGALIGEAASTASALMNGLDSAANESLNVMKSVVSQESEQSQFGLDSSQGTLDRIQGMANSSVVSSVSSAADTAVAVSASEDEISEANAHHDESLQTVDEKIKSISSSVSHLTDFSFSRLNKQMGDESRLYNLQLSQVRKFIKNTNDAWMKYVDYEKSKFEKMSSNDQVSLTYLENAITNGLAMGRNSINSTSGRIQNISSDLAEEKLKLEDFKIATESREMVVSGQMANLVSETEKRGSNVTNLVRVSNSTATTDWESNRSAIASALTSFYSGLDKIESQVMED